MFTGFTCADMSRLCSAQLGRISLDSLEKTLELELELILALWCEYFKTTEGTLLWKSSIAPLNQSKGAYFQPVDSVSIFQLIWWKQNDSFDQPGFLFIFIFHVLANFFY